MNVREEPSNFINSLRLIERQKKIIKDLKLNIKEEKNDGCLNLVENNENTFSNSFEVNFNQSLPINILDHEKSLYFKDKANITDKSYHLLTKGLKLHDKTAFIKKTQKEQGICPGY